MSVEKTGTPFDFHAAAFEEVDPLLLWGAELREFASAMVASHGIDAARAALVEAAGPRAAAAAAGVCATFQMMNRTVESVGWPLPNHAPGTADRLGIEMP